MIFFLYLLVWYLLGAIGAVLLAHYDLLVEGDMSLGEVIGLVLATTFGPLLLLLGVVRTVMYFTRRRFDLNRIVFRSRWGQ
ncbi:MAG: hypothetical protein ACAH27_05630 [Xanthobacteraceae bacterium]